MSVFKKLKNKKGVTDLYPFVDKEQCLINYDLQALNQLIHIFEWKNLPDTIPDYNLELILLICGHAIINKKDNNLYAFFGGLGGIPDEYYFPTQSFVNNPFLKFNKIGEIDKNSIVIRNDTLIQGVMPILHRYHSQMVENDITQHMANINMRIMNVLTASDDSDKASCDKFIDDLISGKLGTIQADGFIDTVHSQPYGSNGQGNQVTQLIEYATWLKARLFQEFGVNGQNSNIKREYVSDSEINLYNNPNTGTVNDMLICRQRGADEVNKMFGTNITVDFSDEWKRLMNLTDESEKVEEEKEEKISGEEKNEE